jgi:hypothetical protein
VTVKFVGIGSGIPTDKKKMPMPVPIGSGICGYPNPWEILASSEERINPVQREKDMI